MDKSTATVLYENVHPQLVLVLWGRGGEAGRGGGVCSYALRGMQEVIFQKRVREFHRGFKHEKTDESTRPQAECFYCVGVFETPMKHEVRVFEITSPTKEN